MESTYLDYLSKLVVLLKSDDRLPSILDEHGYVPQISFGSIGVDELTDLQELHKVLRELGNVALRPIKTSALGSQIIYSFEVAEPIYIRFFCVQRDDDEQH